MLKLSGRVVDTERKVMDQTDPNTGEVVRAAVQIAYILDGRYTRSCIVDQGCRDLVKEEEVEAVVQVSPSNNGRFNGINWRVLSLVEDAPAARLAS